MTVTNMTNRLFFHCLRVVVGVLLLVPLLYSCMGEQLLNIGNMNEVDNRLQFEVSTGLTTSKAAQGNPFRSTADLQSLGHFYVSAFTPNGTLLRDQQITWNGSAWEYPNPPAYPQTPTLFLAHTNWHNAHYSAFETSAEGIKAIGLQITPDRLSSNGQHDLLLAAHRSQGHQQRVPLYFRHPLAQISFRAGNIAPHKIDVLITEIAIVNVASQADLLFPDANGNPSWSNLSTPNSTYIVQGLATNPDNIAQAYTVPDLSATPTDYSRFPRIQTTPPPADNTLMLIPQEFEPWDPTGSIEAPEQHKAYLRMRILIKRAGLQPSDPDAHHFVYAGAIDLTQQSFIPTYAYAPLASIPKKTGHWQAGKKINYILNFGDNFTPSGGGGYDKDGKPILVPIRFSFPVTAIVDDWLNASVPIISISYPK